MSATDRPDFLLRLGPLDAATAAWLLDFCGHLQQAIWRTYGDEIEAYWAATEPEQPIYGHLRPGQLPPQRASGRKRTAPASRSASARVRQ
jgi:hypothetical protein